MNALKKVFIAAQLTIPALAWLNDRSQKPVIGFNTYNDAACSPNASYVEQRLEQLQQLGFLDAGYQLFHLDCGWAGFNRTDNGSLTWDPTRFPDGIMPLSEKATGMGLDWGMYTDTGYYMCDTAGGENIKRPASAGHEYQDSATFAAWNSSYVKIDNCWLTPDNQGNSDPRTDYPSRYGNFSDAFKEVGIPLLAMCQWAVPYLDPEGGLEEPAQWAPPVSTSFRVAGDIYSQFNAIQNVWNEALNANYRGLNGPGGFVDMDILEVGNGALTAAESQTHFAVWASFKSTLLASTDLSNPTQDTLDTLLNKDMIAIHQDDLAIPVQLIQRFTDDHDLYRGPLANGDQFVLLADFSNAKNTLSVNLTELGVGSATVKNIWTGERQNATGVYSESVEAHGSLPLRLSNIQNNTYAAPNFTYYEAESGTYTGNASTASCDVCSGGKRAAWMCGDGTSFTLSGIAASATEMDLQFDYLNADFYTGINIRGATVSVNGGQAQNVQFPLTGFNWATDLWKGYMVRLSGFNVGAGNTITVGTLTSLSTCAPDFDRIGVPLPQVG